MRKLRFRIAIRYFAFRYWLAKKIGTRERIRHFDAKLGAYLAADLGRAINDALREEEKRPRKPVEPMVFELSNEPVAGDIICPGPNGMEVWTPDMSRMKRIL